MVSNQELLDVLRIMGNKLDSEGDYKVNIFFDESGPFFAQTYANSSAFVCLRAFKMPGDNQRTLLEIAGGGAHSAPTDGRLFQHLLMRGLDFYWGGPFARVLGDGTVTYGSRLTLPSDLLSTANDSFMFVTDMIEVMGKASRSLAQELVPRFGGQSFCGVEKDDIRIVAALSSAASLG
jgi:hypothetical protein